jgi:hypothetical protein
MLPSRAAPIKTNYSTIAKKYFGRLTLQKLDLLYYSHFCQKLFSIKPLSTQGKTIGAEKIFNAIRITT